MYYISFKHINYILTKFLRLKPHLPNGPLQFAFGYMDFKVRVLNVASLVLFGKQGNLLIIEEKIVKKCSHFKLGQITSRALPTSYSKGNVSPCLGFSFLQKKKRKRNFYLPDE